MAERGRAERRESGGRRVRKSEDGKVVGREVAGQQAHCFVGFSSLRRSGMGMTGRNAVVARGRPMARYRGVLFPQSTTRTLYHYTPSVSSVNCIYLAGTNMAC
uniref:Uncharacterized protein n=1 Tax=Setaria digitata TaxID=48799 RepID=A0A915PRG5_9BILA